MVTSGGGRVDWVVLLYRVPREPSSPRIAIWRRLRALGVGQLGDGAVALPEDARTREHLEWVADRVLDAGGTALLLRAQALARKDERSIADAMAQARAAEYHALTARGRTALTELRSSPSAGAVTDLATARALRRMRKDLQTVRRRDYFPPPARDEAEAAISELAAALTSSPEGIIARSEPHAAEGHR